MDTLKFRDIGTSVGATFPKEYLKHMGVESGDQVFITKEPGGRVVLSPYDPNFARVSASQMLLTSGFRVIVKLG